MKTIQILHIDDDRNFSSFIRETLGSQFNVDSALTSEQFRTQSKRFSYDLFIVDLEINGKPEGLDLIEEMALRAPNTPIIALSGHQNFTWLKQAMKLGAKDYILKSSLGEELKLSILKTIDSFRVKDSLGRAVAELKKDRDQGFFVGQSKAARNLLKKIEKTRPTQANILITGETGTGKEVVAKLLRRSETGGDFEPFVAIDSSTIQSTLAESLLFGHEKGSFTGADRAQKGLFEEANGGTLYLDELGNMPLDIQSKLLRVIQEKEIRPMGGAKIMRLDFRVISATNLDLAELCERGLFKPDLFQRLAVIPLEIPPLRERLEDLLPLLEFFEKRLGTRHFQFSDDALRALHHYSWPGNVRELQNLVSYLEVTLDSNRVQTEDLTPSILKEIKQPKQASKNGSKRESDPDPTANYKNELVDAEKSHRRRPHLGTGERYTRCRETWNGSNQRLSQAQKAWPQARGLSASVRISFLAAHPPAPHAPLPQFPPEHPPTGSNSQCLGIELIQTIASSSEENSFAAT